MSLAKQTRISDLEFTKNDFIWEYSRFRTFTKWPFKGNARCLPAKMAEAGWYCTKTTADDPCAKCAYCLKELSGWEPTDDPKEEHSKHSKECAFVKLNKPERDFTVADMLGLLEARMLKILEMQHLEEIKKIKDLQEQIVDEFKKKFNKK